MPFNVIAFTSTVLAFFFGSMFNLLYSTDAQIIERSTQTPLGRFRKRLRSLLWKRSKPPLPPQQPVGDARSSQAADELPEKAITNSHVSSTPVR